MTELEMYATANERVKHKWQRQFLLFFSGETDMKMATRCYYCQQKILEVSGIIKHCSSSHPGKELSVLKKCDGNYRSMHYNIVPADMGEGVEMKLDSDR